MKRGLIGFALALVGIVGIVVIGVAAVFLTMPNPRALQGCLKTELYHVDLCKTAPGYTPYEGISHHIIDAVIMSEDASFYSHQGVDLVEMKESLKKDWNEHRFARGASTITQQMVKNVFLSKDKSLVRKAQEIYLALQVEKIFSKKQILTFYMNVVEFGQDIYGVKAACRHYFNQSPGNVTPEQAAFLAFLLPNPKKYSQSFQKKQLTPFASKTIKTILHRMEKSHRLSPEEHEVAVARIGSDLWSGQKIAPYDLNAADTSETDFQESPTGVVGKGSKNGQDDNDQESDEFKFDFGNADSD